MATTELSADDAVAQIQRAQQLSRRDFRVTVRIKNPGGLTAHQTVNATAIHAGIDWEGSQLVIETERPLSTLSAEQVEAITKSVREGSSWHAYEAQKRLRERIRELEAEVASLRPA